MKVESALGRYRIERELGRGSMGRVFLAYDPELDRRIALKSFHLLASLPEGERRSARERFLREARIAARLLHPGIVTVFDVGEAGGTPYLAMEYLEGRSLDAFCRAGDLLPVETAAGLVARGAEALHFAHARGFVHRDIKPSNLMRAGAVGIKITDFGLARGFEASLTHDGTLLGTPSYMSPEQVRGEPLDGRSDLFSLAVVLHELLYGERPFTGETVSAILYRIVHEDPVEPGTGGERVGPRLRGFLRRALAKDPAARFQTGEEFAKALRDAAPARTAAPERGGTPEAPRPVGGPPRLPPGRRRTPLAPYVAGAAAVALALAAGVAWLRGRGEPAPSADPTWLEARVRTEPPGLPVTLDGAPLGSGPVRFRAGGPFPVLALVHGCRKVARALEAADAGGEVVLVADDPKARVLLDAGPVGAVVRVNGREAGRTPATLELDLCAENVIRVEAAGFRPAETRLAAGATPLEARTAVAGLRPEPLPKGRLVLPALPYAARLAVDGSEIRPGAAVELDAGMHEVRVTSEELWLDWRTTVEVEGGGTVRPRLALPPLATLVVQAFPANCRAFLRRGTGPWRYLDDTPVTRRLSPGRYGVKVEFVPTGESRETEVDLRAGDNPPVRISFQGGSS